jgi:glycosyltransferase involved in cell wall biosynthesis
LPFEIRDFCKNNKIDLLSNLGHPFGTIPLIIANIFTNRKTFLYFLGDVLQIHKNTKFSKKKIRLFLTLLAYFPLVHLSDKIAFVGRKSTQKASSLFLKSSKRMHYILAPVNTELFKPKNKKISRKKLGFSPNEKIILLTGKVTYMKGGDILSGIVKSNPGIKFIVIGKWISKEIPLFKSNNLITLDKIPNEDLPEYYSSADLSFAFHRQGDQMGIVGSEALACGTPLLHTKRIAFKDSPAILKIKDSIEEANSKIKTFFSLSNKEKAIISKEARTYAEKYLSDEVWKKRYIDFFLN